MPALTPWFPPSVRPVHRGLYQTRVFGFVGYSYWDGKKWGFEGETKSQAMHLYSSPWAAKQKP